MEGTAGQLNCLHASKLFHVDCLQSPLFSAFFLLDTQKQVILLGRFLLNHTWCKQCCINTTNPKVILHEPLYKLFARTCSPVCPQGPPTCPNTSSLRTLQLCKDYVPQQLLRHQMAGASSVHPVYGALGVRSYSGTPVRPHLFSLSLAKIVPEWLTTLPSLVCLMCIGERLSVLLSAGPNISAFVFN